MTCGVSSHVYYSSDLGVSFILLNVREIGV